MQAATEDEPANNNWGTATRLDANVTFTGTQTNDNDWYEIDVPAGTLRVLIELAFVDADGNMFMNLYEDDGNPADLVPGSLVAIATTDTDNEFIDRDFTGLGGGKKYIQVGGATGSGGNTGNSYTLTWTSFAVGSDDGFEDNDDSANVAVVSEATTVFGIQSDDDWYGISVAPDSSSLGIHLTYITAGSTGADLDMELRDADGNLVASAATATDNETIVQNGLAEGAYKLKVSGPNSDSAYALIWTDESAAPTTTVPPDPVTSPTETVPPGELPPPPGGDSGGLSPLWMMACLPAVFMRRYCGKRH